MPDAVRVIHSDDRDPQPLVTVLATHFAVEAIGLSEIDAAVDLVDRVTIVDVDLSDPDTIRRLRRRLPKRGTAVRLVAVEPGSRLERIQAGILGASDFLIRPFDPVAVLAELTRASRAGRFDVDLGRGMVPEGAAGRSSIVVAEEALADLFSACFEGVAPAAGLLEEAGAQVTRSISEIGFEEWMNVVRRHHDGTYRHCLTVTGVTVGFGVGLGMTRSDIERLARAALAHDVGKARVPVAVLDKPGRLNEAEVALVRCHSEWGWAFLRQADRRMDPMILDTVLHHHEALDGSGYPHGLSGAEIADPTRILTVCDVFSALSEPRAYKSAMTTADAIAVMRDMAAKGKIETALVRALDWIVSGRRPPGLVAGTTPRRSVIGRPPVRSEACSDRTELA